MSSPDFIQFDSFGIPLSAVVASANPAKFAFSHSHQSPGNALRAILERRQAERNGPTFVAALDAEEAAAAIARTTSEAHAASVARGAAAARVGRMTCEADAARAAREAFYRPEQGMRQAEPRPQRMREWAAIRKPGDHWKAPKITTRAINEAHSQYVSRELSLSDYTDKLVTFLLPGGAEDAVLDFLASTSEPLEAGTFCPSTAKFDRLLKKDFLTFSDDRTNVDASENVTPDTEEETKPVVIEGKDKFAGLKKAAMKKRLEKAFANLKANVVGADREFYSSDVGVAYKFVLGRVSNQMYDAGECATDQRDVTNRILYDLSKNIHGVRDIYKHLSSAAWKQGGKAFTKNNEDRDTHVPLMVDEENEDGETYMEDNPELLGNVRYKRGGKVVFQESRPQFPRVLPEFIQGDDLKVCQYRRDNYSYARIAGVLCTTVPAINAFRSDAPGAW